MYYVGTHSLTCMYENKLLPEESEHDDELHWSDCLSAIRAAITPWNDSLVLCIAQ